MAAERMTNEGDYIVLRIGEAKEAPVLPTREELRSWNDEQVLRPEEVKELVKKLFHEL